MVGEFMTYSCLHQKLKNDHSYWTSSRWRNGCYLQRFSLRGAILEELSNQRRSKKIGDDEETKETEPDVLQRQQNKGAKG